MGFKYLLLGVPLICIAASQSIQSLGTSGGSGPNGGIGDANHPVKEAASFITDALIPTSPDSTRQLALGPAPVKSNKVTYPYQDPEARVVVVDSDGGARQELLGFGHSWTDSTVEVFSDLDADVFDQVMKDLYGQEGNNMGMMRHSIGSSDLSYAQYTYDDNGDDFNHGSPDPSLSYFDIGYHGRKMADMIAQMGNYKSDVTLFGSPWSPPGWMKHNGLFIAPELNVPNGGAYYFTNNTFNIEYIHSYASYLAKYVDAFKAQGVKVNAITPQNEPLNNQGGYPTMYLDAVDAASLIAEALGPLMKERDVGIWAYDHNTDMPMYPQRVVEGANGHVQAAAWHCYANPANYSVLDDFHYGNPDMLQFMTECSNYKPQAGTHNFQVGYSFIPPIQHWASGATMWVMATDASYGPHSPFGGCDGCSGSIIVNSSRNYTKTHDYYMIGQFSRFIRRGAVNYHILSGNEGSVLTNTQFWVLAAENPDRSWAVVFMNNYLEDQKVSLQFTGDGLVWEGVVPNATVTTWQIPASH
jgi:O-glycosyl hydrolase